MSNPGFFNYAVDIGSVGVVNLLVSFAAPVAGFNESPTNGSTPLTVTFTDASSGLITNWFWDFGDGVTTNTATTSVAHTYNTVGDETAELIVSGPGGSSTNTQVNAVTVTCGYSLSATNASFSDIEGTGTVTVSTPNTCPWTASSNDSWIQMTGGTVNATGSAAVVYTVLPNSASTNPRLGAMTIAGQTFTVTQAGDTTAPTVVLTAPTFGSVSGAVAVSATATDDIAVARVEFYLDTDILLGTVVTPPYVMTFNATTVNSGSHCFSAEAYDPAGNVGSSATNCVFVSNTAPSPSAQTMTIRVVAYNIMDDIDGFTTPLAGLVTPSSGGTFTTSSSGTVTNGGVLEGIGEENVGGDPAQPIDILALEETTSNPITVQPIVDGLNTFYSASNPGGSNLYALSTYQATESGGFLASGNGPSAMVYNTKTVQLLASVPVDPSCGTNCLGAASGEYREVMRYEFAPAGGTPTVANEFYIYVSHYKSGVGATNMADRAVRL